MSANLDVDEWKKQVKQDAERLKTTISSNARIPSRLLLSSLAIIIYYVELLSELGDIYDGSKR